MEMQHKESGSGGKFYIENNGERVAAIVYEKRENMLVIEHTEVDKALRGQNIGYQLVEKTVDHARKNRLKVSPVCPFARRQFEKNPEWKDVMV